MILSETNRQLDLFWKTQTLEEDNPFMDEELELVDEEDPAFD